MTTSKFEALGQQKRTYKGLQFFDITSPIKAKVPVTFALSCNEKASMTGFLSFDRHQKSYIFNDEVVISCWSINPPKIEKRAVNQGYFRCEISVPLDVFERMVAVAINRLHNFRLIQRNQSIQKIGDFL